MLDRDFREFAKLATLNSGTKSVEDASLGSGCDIRKPTCSANSFIVSR
jgi:hypothetical protein